MQPDLTDPSNMSNTPQRSSGNTGRHSSSIDVAQHMFAVRPAKSNCAAGKPVQLFTNNYKLILTGKELQKYAITYTPDVPDNSKVGRKLTSLCKETLKAKFENYILWGNSLYSLIRVADDIEEKVTHDGQEYSVRVAWAKDVHQTDIKEYQAFVSIFFKRLVGKLSFLRDGRNMFNPLKAKNIQNLEVWPGFFSSVQKLQSGPLIQIDLTSKVIRTDKLLAEIEQMQDKGKTQEQINDALENQTVVTSYGKTKKNYRITRIDFNQSPMSTFKKGKEGEETEISYMDYYKQQYNVQISNPNQPLVVSKNPRTGTEIALVPELCEMTGLTDGQRANFNLMRDLGQILHKGGQERMQEVRSLMDEIKSMPRAKELMDQWKVDFDKQPLKVQGQRLNGGQIMMGNNFQFDAHCHGTEFDRNVQKTMLQQGKLAQWAIIHGRSSAREANVLSQEFQKVIQSAGFKCSPPRLMQVDGNDRQYQSWEQTFKANLNPKVDMVVIVLQGNKNGAPLYDQIKKLLFTQMPCPSQVVLHNTIARGKNLRSIITKILIQINAKIAGEPWAVSDMPFTSCPTMIVAYDVHHKLKGKSHLAYTATTNRNFTKHWSTYIQQREFQEVADKLQPVVEESINAFKNQNGIFPKQIIFYRDGVGDSQKNAIMKNEISQIRAALNSKEEWKGIKILYMMVNKRIKTKLIADAGGRCQNPQPGTVLDHSITHDGVYDFFLVSVSTRQGVPTPSHYTVLVDEIKEPEQKVYDLTYKLCYTYYNYSGPVKVPGPIKYADKLAGTMGDRNIDQPHQAWKNFTKLYFI